MSPFLRSVSALAEVAVAKQIEVIAIALCARSAIAVKNVFTTMIADITQPTSNQQLAITAVPAL
ncbi:MAG TPA: hypothetical protein DEG17_18010, partial [Cyanobacteria bacterium UBA11149]|nr:hypothetical protein [Cyanobacteria bacterium UBA11366]HBK65538.1 hypothetical protein [Cyanobacteria bacterium UBA11166]HBR74999.1 hypothetical protein [Cyanobacteria bacterium UBA11159]HBW90713.1 hypothetical protein [Cyanobacteria bacterium UBA11149]HCA94012.1 hypothetical protein [Cyanobacteria bacterium UBA9226]